MVRTRFRAGVVSVAAGLLAALSVTVVTPAANAAAAGSGPLVRFGAAVPTTPRGAVSLGTVAATQTVDGAVDLKPADPAALRQFVAEVSNPGSPLYHHYLGRGQFGPRFGASASTVAAVRSWLAARGVTRTTVASNGLSVQFAAPASTVTGAFGVQLRRFRLGSGRVAFEASASPLVPQDLAGAIDDVSGLSSVVAPRSHVELSSRSRPVLAATPGRSEGPVPASHAGHVVPRPALGSSGVQPCQQAAELAYPNEPNGSVAYDPGDLASAYGLDSLYAQGRFGAGVTVALVELETYSSSDVADYQQCMGTGVPITDLVENPGPQSGQQNEGAESALDIEQLIGLAPELAGIRVYQAEDLWQGEMADLTQIADDDDAQVVSTSWGDCEDAVGSADEDAEETLFEQMAAQGQSMFAAAGDAGSEDCLDAGGDTEPFSLAVDDPAADPYVTGVGGTSLDGDSTSSEDVWNNCEDQPGCYVNQQQDGLGAGGGGVSQTFTEPSWQGTGATGREVPDVSADADPGTGVLIVWDGQWYDFGGTSAAAPLWAAIAADVDQGCAAPVGYLNPDLYRLARADASAFHDVTSGNNDFTDTNGGDYAARSGYDLASGWGSPNATALLGGADGLEPNDCPVVSSVSPGSGWSTGGTTVTIAGTDLSGATAVSFGSVPAASFSYSSGTGEITAVEPVGPTGTVTVSVTTPAGTTAASAADQFSVNSPPPPTSFPGSLDNPNLVTDPAFQSGMGAWQANPGQNYAIYASSSAPVDGSYLETNAGSSSSPSLYQDTASAPAAGHSYQASVFLRSPTSTPIDVAIVLWTLGGTTEAAQSDVTVSSSTWTRYTTDLDVADTGHVALRLQVFWSGPANVDVDDAVLQDTGVGDAGFSHGLGPWGVTPGQNWAIYPSSSSPVGSDYLETNIGGTLSPSLYQYVATPPTAGHTYQASLEMRSPSSAPIGVALVVWALGGSTEVGQSDFTVSSPTWNDYSADVDAIVGGHSGLLVQVYFSGSADLDVGSASLEDTNVADAGFQQLGLGSWSVSEGANWANGSGVGPSGSGEDWLDTNAGSSPSSSLYQDVPSFVVAGQPCTATLDLKSFGAPIPVAVVLWALGGSAPAEVAQTYVTVGSSWQAVSTELDVAHPGHSDLRLQLYVGSSAATLGVTAADLIER